MRLYTRTGATALTDPETGIHYNVDADGGFNFPDDLSDKLHKFAVRGQPMWEDDIERQRRLMSEEMERRKDPATLLDAVQQILNAAKATQMVSAVDAAKQEPVPAAEDGEPRDETEAPAAAPETAPPARKTAANRRTAAKAE